MERQHERDTEKKQAAEGEETQHEEQIHELTEGSVSKRHSEAKAGSMIPL